MQVIIVDSEPSAWDSFVQSAPEAGRYHLSQMEKDN